MRLTLRTPAGFSFRQTVISHGWSTLGPFRFDPGRDTLESVVALPGGGAVAFGMRPKGRDVLVESSAPSVPSTRRVLSAAARRILNLDLDLTEFYRMTNEDERLKWVAGTGAGRLLRCPTVFEDLVKLVLTTNCSWALTTRMIDTLIGQHGEPAADGRRCFPGAEAIARIGVRGLRDRVKVGYRAPLLDRLARDVAEGRVDPERWETDDRPPEELRREMLDLPGVGPYVAENMLKFLGRPAGLALDSWLRSKYGRVYHGGRRVTDRTIARRYARFGPWGGMALWCDMTRDWLVDGELSSTWETLD